MQFKEASLPIRERLIAVLSEIIYGNELVPLYDYRAPVVPAWIILGQINQTEFTRTKGGCITYECETQIKCGFQFPAGSISRLQVNELAEIVLSRLNEKDLSNSTITFMTMRLTNTFTQTEDEDDHTLVVQNLIITFFVEL